MNSFYLAELKGRGAEERVQEKEGLEIRATRLNIKLRRSPSDEYKRRRKDWRVRPSRRLFWSPVNVKSKQMVSRASVDASDPPGLDPPLTFYLTQTVDSC